MLVLLCCIACLGFLIFALSLLLENGEGCISILLADYSVFVSQSVWMEIGIQLNEQKLLFRMILLLVK